MPTLTLKISAKDIKRLGLVIENALLLTLPRLGNMLLSVAVVYMFGAAAWGKIVVLQVAHYILSNIMSWGNKEYLLRSYSERPYDITRLFQVSLTTRAVLWIPVLAVLWIIDYPLTSKLHLLVWLLCQYIYQSFESLINYERRFKTGIWIEFIAPAFALLVVYLLRSNPGQAVLYAFTTLFVIKTVVMTVTMRRYLQGKYYAFQGRMLLNSVNFALLIFTGMLQSRTDVLYAIHYLDKQNLAYYQILTNFLLIFQTSSTFLFQPFVKNFYRAPEQQGPLFNMRLLSFGIGISIVATPAMVLVMEYVYKFSMSPLMIICAFVYMLAPFAYLPAIYRLYKQHLTNRVILVNILGTGLLILLFISAIRLFSATPETALLAATAHQVFISFLLIMTAHGKARI